MKVKTLAVLVLVVSATLMVSGCVDFLRRTADRVTGGECIELEKKAETRPGMDCKCYPTDFIPEGVKNQTDMEQLEGKCYCTCSFEETDEEANISIVEGPDGNTIISQLT
ncbi:MAG: hypothetical protein ACLFQ8_00585 [Candidatus Aenigmatarchaeota archaeon]